MIFLTVGTCPIPFDRLVATVDNAIAKGLVDDDIFAQIGICRYKPKNMKYANVLDKDEFDSYLRGASGIIGHAGMGTIIMALEHDKPLLVMPRMRRLGEHVNDHQLSTARKFEQLGHILAAYEARQLGPKIRSLKHFAPKKRLSEAEAVSYRLGLFLNTLTAKR